MVKVRQTKFVFMLVATLLLAAAGWSVASVSENPSSQRPTHNGDALAAAENITTCAQVDARSASCNAVTNPSASAQSANEDKRRDEAAGYSLSNNRPTFSFHYLDILEWLFQRGGDKPHQQQNAFR